MPPGCGLPIQGLLASLLAGWSLAASAAGAPAAPAGDAADFFRAHVAPLLATRCGGCHGPAAAESGLRLDERARAIAGGDSGTAGIVPGDPSKSEIYRRVVTADAEARMPADAEPLPAAERELLAAWIATGAVWPEDLASIAPLFPAGTTKPLPGAGHWAFAPVVRPPVPAASAGTASSSVMPIDAFVLEKLAAVGLAMNPEADPRTLLRRVSFDLIGLPPAPEEIAAFEAAVATDGIDRAYSAAVDRLLASPHHGERWARHWLDVVRFAESHGFEMNRTRPNAWPYRDWVIAAFNDDLPYDEFVRRQLCGDQLDADAATGFLVGGPMDMVKSPDVVLTANQRADELHDMVGTTGSAFLGLTVGCARCHDHKFDPVPQTDYYRLKAVFAGVTHGERAIPDPPRDAERQREIAAWQEEVAAAEARLAEWQEAVRVFGGRVLEPPVSPRENVDTFPAVRARFLRFTVLATAGNAQPCIDELEVFATDGGNVARGAVATASGTLPGSDVHKIEHVNDGAYGNARSWLSDTPGKGWVQLAFAEPAEIRRIVWSRDRSPKPRHSDRVPTRYEVAVSDDGEAWQTVASDKPRMPHGSTTTLPGDFSVLPAEDQAEAESLVARVAVLKQRIKDLRDAPKAYIGQFVQPGATHRLFRGDPLATREEVPPGSLTRVAAAFTLPPDAPERDRRLALADWIVAPENPLTARVIVNRLWHYHFGTGIVDTPSDFGVNGGPPSHRELLDWLAAELAAPADAADRWRLKRIHRMIVMSRAYRQSGATRPEAMEVDSAARLLWRFPPRRLEAEAIRDAILAVSGSLDTRMGGPGFDLFEPNGNYVKVYVTKTAFTSDDFRRMVYQTKPRAELDTFFGAFDCPDAGQVQPKRTSSTTPLQALNMLNGDFLLDQAGRFAARVEREAGPDPARQVARAIELAFGRPATAAELAAGRELVAGHGLAILCRSIYNASEFLTVH